MKTRINILIGFFLTMFTTSCSDFENKQTSPTSDNDFGNRQNPLYGIIYRNTSEVSQFNNYENIGGSVIDNLNGKQGNFEFGIGHLTDSIRHILVFEKFVREPNNPQPKYQILDTINIDNIKENEYITYCLCQQDTIFDPEIIALVIADEDKEYYDEIVRAWRADTKTGKIMPIKNTKGISCVNEGYGLDGCVGDENIEQTIDANTIDTLHNN